MHTRLIRPIRTGEQMGGVIAGDASDRASFSYSLHGQLFSTQTKFQEAEQNSSSGYRELLNIYNTLQVKGDIFKSTSEIKIYYWLTDSKNVYYWFRSGSTRENVQQLIVKIYKLMYSLKIRIVMQWMPRTSAQIQLADIGSKYLDTDDWGICDKSLNTLQIVAKNTFTCDVFASCTNNRFRKFYSKVAAPHSAGINAFAQNWEQDFNFCCPPVKYITHVIQHLNRTSAQGVLIVPMWQGAVFWPRLTIDGKHLLSMFFKHSIFRPVFRKGEFCDKNLFDGYKSHFEMIALYFNSTIPSDYSKNFKNRCLAKTCDLCK
jgi:hypothetical protein